MASFLEGFSKYFGMCKAGKIWAKMGQGIVRKQGTTNANECTMCGMGEYDLHRIQNAAEYSCIYV